MRARKVECLQSLKTNKALESELEVIEKKMANHEIKLKRDSLGFALKTLDGNATKWRKIQSECSTLLAKIKSLDEELKEKLVVKHWTEFWPNTSSNTQLEHLCGTLFLAIDSTIVNSDKLKSDLVNLCKLRGKQFKLIYRASRDGFEASSFHAKCDDQPKTLTLIRSAKGFIFGGYTSRSWTSKICWKRDPTAFIFSLVNAISTPQFISIQVGDTCALRCDPCKGPTFGQDICIADNSNTGESNAQLGCSYDFKLFSYQSPKADSFLAGSSEFLTSEIEVFKLI